jgi:prophage DNA circulation protein
MRDLRLFGRLERQLRAQVHGRALDLADLQRARAESMLEELVAAGEHLDSIVSILQLSRMADPLRAARAIERLIGDTGELFFLEPTTSPGLPTVVQRAVGQQNHNIPAILRKAGLSMSVCERITVNSALPAHMYVHGAAFRTIDPARIAT